MLKEVLTSVKLRAMLECATSAGLAGITCERVMIDRYTLNSSSYRGHPKGEFLRICRHMHLR